MPTNADGTMGHLQNSDLFYLCGIRQEETILLICPDAPNPMLCEVLFIRESNPLLTIWQGYKYTKEDAQRISGIQNVQWLSAFPAIFRELMCHLDTIYLNTNDHYRADDTVQSRDDRFIRQCKKDWPLHQYCRLSKLMTQLRPVKSPIEIEVIKKACDITGLGFNRVLCNLYPGINEAEIEANFAFEFIRNKADFAYLPIIASGSNSCVLHYIQNDRVCKDGDLVLLDVAAGYGNYMSDLSRTIPVSGRFTKRQKDVYNSVLTVYNKMFQAFKPGQTIADLRALCDEFTTEECVRLGLFSLQDLKKQDPKHPLVHQYFMHGVSHSIGLDVHDLINPYEPINTGWVFSCEPGVYIREEGFGIRLENTVYLSPNGPVNLMADIPIEAEHIEQIIQDSKRV